MADSPTPLATAAQMTEGPFGNLASQLSVQALNDIMIEATRLCESELHRRLAPFTITESHRLDGMDPDEYTDAGNLPLDLQGTLGRSYAYALGASTLVRHCWLDQCAPMYPEYWTYTVQTVQIFRSYGGSEIIPSTQYVGPEVDTGHIWFNLGKFIPIGSMARITYSGGYTVAVPADLVRACKYMAASLIVRELNPEDSSHDPDLLHTDALFCLANWARL